MIVTLKGPEGLEARLDQNGLYWIGRSNDSTISVNGQAFDEAQLIARRHTSINKEHLQLLVETDSLRLTDENSTFGSYLDEKQFTIENITELGTYSLRLGNVEFELRCEAYPSQD